MAFRRSLRGLLTHLCNLLKLLLGDLFLILVLVGVPLHRHLAVRLLELIGARILVDAERSIVGGHGEKLGYR